MQSWRGAQPARGVGRHAGRQWAGVGSTGNTTGACAARLLQQAQEQQGTGMKLPAVRQERQRTGVDALQVPAPSYWRAELYVVVQAS